MVGYKACDWFCKLILLIASKSSPLCESVLFTFFIRVFELLFWLSLSHVRIKWLTHDDIKCGPFYWFRTKKRPELINHTQWKKKSESDLFEFHLLFSLWKSSPLEVWQLAWAIYSSLVRSSWNITQIWTEAFHMALLRMCSSGTLDIQPLLFHFSIVIANSCQCIGRVCICACRSSVTIGCRLSLLGACSIFHFLALNTMLNTNFNSGKGPFLLVEPNHQLKPYYGTFSHVCILPCSQDS